LEGYQGGRGISCVLGKKTKEKNGSVRERFSSEVWKGVVHGKDVCKQEHGRKLCVVVLEVEFMEGFLC
jgi:hypothetical protein